MWISSLPFETMLYAPKLARVREENTVCYAVISQAVTDKSDKFTT